MPKSCTEKRIESAVWDLQPNNMQLTSLPVKVGITKSHACPAKGTSMPPSATPATKLRRHKGPATTKLVTRASPVRQVSDLPRKTINVMSAITQVHDLEQATVEAFPFPVEVVSFGLL